MIRNGLLGGLAMLVLVAAGCAKSDEGRERADAAKGGLMPAEEPGFEAAYVADQKQVKLAAAREISYEPLDSFRDGAVPPPRAGSPAEPAADSGSSPEGKRRGLFGRLKDTAASKISSVTSLLPSGGGGGGEQGNQREVGVDGVYTNTDFACRLTVPDKSWRMTEDVPASGDNSASGNRSAPRSAAMRIKIPNTNEAAILFVALPLPANVPAKALTDQRLDKLFKPMFDDFQLITNERREVNGAQGQVVCFSGVSKDKPDSKYRRTEIVWKHGAFCYLLSLNTLEAEHDTHMPDFEKLLASFEYLGD